MAPSLVRTLPLLATIGLGACISNRPILPAPVNVEPARGECHSLGNSYDCARLIEARQLSQAKNWINRRNGEICFRLTLGGQTCVANEEPSESKVKRFSYLGSLARPNYHVLWVQYYEGNSFLLINAANGNRTLMDALPIPSPDARYLAVAPPYLEAGYNPDRLSIWLVRDDTLEEVWSTEPAAWALGSVHWVDSTRLQVSRVRVDGITGHETAIQPAAVQLKDGMWRLVEPK